MRMRFPMKLLSKEQFALGRSMYGTMNGTTTHTAFAGFPQTPLYDAAPQWLLAEPLPNL